MSDFLKEGESVVEHVTPAESFEPPAVSSSSAAESRSALSSDPANTVVSEAASEPVAVEVASTLKPELTPREKTNPQDGNSWAREVELFSQQTS